jgi:CRISPR-associated protein Cas2
MAEYMHLVIAYDVESNRRRNRLVKLLKDYGERVNLSVFECRIKRQTYGKLKKEVSSVVDMKKDSVLFYELCMQCIQKKDSFGIKLPDRVDSVVTV